MLVATVKCTWAIPYDINNNKLTARQKKFWKSSGIIGRITGNDIVIGKRQYVECDNIPGEKSTTKLWFLKKAVNINNQPKKSGLNKGFASFCIVTPQRQAT